MKFTGSAVFLAFASLVTAQNDTAAPAAPSAPSAPGGNNGPATPNAQESITIITPTGNTPYNVGDTMQITWTNNAPSTDTQFQYTDITFELADASGGPNKVSPLGVYIQSNDAAHPNASVGLLEFAGTIPQVKAGPAYCIRADIKTPTGFIYYFSPTFPIGMPLSSASSAVAPAGAGAAATSGSAPASTNAGGSAAPTGNAQVSPTALATAANTSRPSSGVATAAGALIVAATAILFY
ncbi:hypothetical protein BC830DRAFT_1120089 [Chytriomyces sp. MP71]|nr:hypothetical protein BC830DRAFT_1120089 [Chytriomyces sp. MP71]